MDYPPIIIIIIMAVANFPKSDAIKFENSFNLVLKSIECKAYVRDIERFNCCTIGMDAFFIY